MGGTKTKQATDDEMRMSVVAAASLGHAFSDFKRLALAPDALAGRDSVRAITAAVSDARESLRLTGALYPAGPKKAWARRLKTLALDLEPVDESDRLVEGLGAVGETLGDGGRRAVAFLMGHHMLVADIEADYAADRLDRFEIADKAKAFAKFATAPKRSGAGKVGLRSFAAVTLTDRLDVMEAWIEATAIDDDREVWHALQVAARRVAAVVELAAVCYAPEAAEAARVALAQVGAAVSRIRDLDAVIDAVGDPDMTLRARTAGVTTRDLSEVVRTLRTQRRRAVVDARKTLASLSVTERRALVLDPVVPGYAPAAPEPAPVVAPAVVAETVAEAKPEPVIEEKAEPVTAPKPKAPAAAKPKAPAAAKPAAKPVANAAPKPAAEPAAKVTPKPAAKPAPDAAAKPAAVPAPKPAPRRRTTTPKPPATES